jgi:hypothetical protein
MGRAAVQGIMARGTRSLATKQYSMRLFRRWIRSKNSALMANPILNPQPDFPQKLAMNKFVNLPDHFFAEMLEGIALANPDKLKYVPRQRRIFRCQ